MPRTLNDPPRTLNDPPAPPEGAPPPNSLAHPPHGDGKLGGPAQLNGASAPPATNRGTFLVTLLRALAAWPA